MGEIKRDAICISKHSRIETPSYNNVFVMKDQSFLRKPTIKTAINITYALPRLTVIHPLGDLGSGSPDPSANSKEDPVSWLSPCSNPVSGSSVASPVSSSVTTGSSSSSSAGIKNGCEITKSVSVTPSS